MKLIPRGNNQNEVEISETVTVFFSYKTPVAAHICGRGYLKTEKFWSKTTSRHVNQWIDGPATTVPQAELDNLTDTDERDNRTELARAHNAAQDSKV